jgi:Lon protease-like protein
MNSGSFTMDFSDLPDVLAVFPLEGVLLLPRGRLSLNVFESRYVNMVDAALKSDRMIGMIQPRHGGAGGDGGSGGSGGSGGDDHGEKNDKNGEDDSNDGDDPLYRIGCGGRIFAFQETTDGRYEITLEGVCRFETAEELASLDGYRRVRPDWEPFAGDIESELSDYLDHDRIQNSVRQFFDLHGIKVDWDVISATTDENLIASLTMGCPFAANEKQALLEATGLTERTNVLISLIEIALLENRNDDIPHQ